MEIWPLDAGKSCRNAADSGRKCNVTFPSLPLYLPAYRRCYGRLNDRWPRPTARLHRRRVGMTWPRPLCSRDSRCQFARRSETFAAVDATWKVMEALHNEEELEEWESRGIIKAWRKTPETWALWVMDKYHVFHRIQTFSIDNAASCAEATRAFVAHEKENRKHQEWALTKYERQKQQELRRWFDQWVQNDCALMWGEEQLADKTPTSSNNSSNPPFLFDSDSETKSTSTYGESSKRRNGGKGSVDGI